MSTDDHTNETSSGQPSADLGPVQQYEIRVRGHLGSRWATWFDGMSLSAESDGTTVIRGTVVDQAALHGLLQTLRDLGITLLSLIPLMPATSVEQSDDSHNHNHNHNHIHGHTHHSPGATS